MYKTKSVQKALTPEKKTSTNTHLTVGQNAMKGATAHRCSNTGIRSTAKRSAVGLAVGLYNIFSLLRNLII